MVPTILLSLIPVTAALAIFGETVRPRRPTLVYLFKPATTALVIALALALPAPDPVVRSAIVLGLVLSLAGDVFLMLPADRFLAGLASFLLAHLAYLSAFTRPRPLADLPLIFLVVGIVAAAVLTVLWGGVPRRMKLAVVAYVVVLGAMTSQAAVLGVTLGTPPAAGAAAGGALFFVSDAALAYDRFRRPFRWARAVVLATYWAAQVLIAVSVGMRV